MKSTILAVAGRYREARQVAVPLFMLPSPLALTVGTAPTRCHGHLGEAGKHFRTALRIDPHSPYLLKNYADYLLIPVKSALAADNTNKIARTMAAIERIPGAPSIRKERSSPGADDLPEVITAGPVSLSPGKRSFCAGSPGK